MATTPTQNDVPSNAPVDLRYNSEQFDRVINSPEIFYTDRFGKKRITMYGVEQLANAFEETFTNKLGAQDGYNLIGSVKSFDALRKVRPAVEGQRIFLSSYYEGGRTGGGVFIGHFGQKTDNAGTVAAFGDYWWERIEVLETTPEQFGAVGDGNTDDTVALQNAINAAGASTHKSVKISSTYNVSGQLSLPNSVTVYGLGLGTGVVVKSVPGNLFKVFYLNGSDSSVKDLSIQFNISGMGSVSTQSMYGVFLDSSATNCKVSNCYVNGRYLDNAMGYSNGIRVTGTNNTIEKNKIEHCSMGITARGTHHTIHKNWCCNHFVDKNLGAWTQASFYWDGITCEGLSYSEISGNVCEYNGQSGIYMGGNNSLSHTNLVSGNFCYANYNRGFDFGVSGTVSSTNNVTKLRVVDNHSKDNREPQIWLYAVNESIISNNIAETTEDYTTLFSGYLSSNVAGISVGTNYAVNNVITDNRINMGYSNAPWRAVWNGTGNIVENNRISGYGTDYVFANDAGRLINNNLSRYQGTFTPSIITGAGVTITASTATYSITDKVLKFDIYLTLAGTTPTGNLVLGYIPGVGSATIRFSDVRVGMINGWSSITGALKAYQDGTNKDQIVIYRENNGGRNYDAASFVSTASTIRITGEIEVSPGY